MIKCKIPFFCECGKNICCVYCDDKNECGDRCAFSLDPEGEGFNPLDECKNAYKEEKQNVK